MRTKATAVALLVLVSLGPSLSAQQSLNYSLFERYVAALREQSAIPGLSAAIVQGGRVAWSAGFGSADVAGAIPARPDTPYPILDLSQTLASTVLLQQCVDFGHLEVTDPVRRWISDYPVEDATIGQLLSHTTPGGAYQYDRDRFAALDEVIHQCANRPYPALLAEEILERFSMIDSAPGTDLGNAASPNRALFSGDQLERYAGVLQRLAVPYRVDDRGRPTRSTIPAVSLSPSTGAVSSALDLASFDLAIRDGILLTPATLRLAWPQNSATPTGLGWFIQRVGNDTVVWHAGAATDGFSSLMIKVPGRDLTVILLANSDRLSAPYAAGAGDVNASIFARLFFRIFLV